MIVGPCSIHDEEAALEYAGRLVDLSKKLSDRLLILMRVYFEKPRTTIGWKGLIHDPHLDGTLDIETGLHRARALLLKIGEMGMYAGTEFLLWSPNIWRVWLRGLPSAPAPRRARSIARWPAG